VKGARTAATGLTVALALIASSCTPGGTPAGKLRAWESAAGYRSSQSLLSTDVDEIANGIRLGPLAALHTACDGLGVDASTAYGNLPTSDEQLTNDLNDEYLALSAAAEDCSEAPSRHGKAIARYRAEIAKAQSAEAAARRRIAAIGG
jgi:hypothetical protein